MHLLKLTSSWQCTKNLQDTLIPFLLAWRYLTNQILKFLWMKKIKLHNNLDSSSKGLFTCWEVGRWSRSSCTGPSLLHSAYIEAQSCKMTFFFLKSWWHSVAEPYKHTKVSKVMWIEAAAPLFKEGAWIASNQIKPHQLTCLPTGLLWNAPNIIGTTLSFNKW
jgi:hypothetical protein